MLTRWLVSRHDFYEALQIGVKNLWVFAVALQILQGAVDNYQGLIHFFLPMDFSEYLPAVIDVVRGRFGIFLIFPWKRRGLYNRGSVFLKGTGYNFFDCIFYIQFYRQWKISFISILLTPLAFFDRYQPTVMPSFFSLCVCLCVYVCV